jgi:tripartite ATP-independent transporter DctP family solute receptor
MKKIRICAFLVFTLLLMFTSACGSQGATKNTAGPDKGAAKSEGAKEPDKKPADSKPADNKPADTKQADSKQFLFRASTPAAEGSIIHKVFLLWKDEIEKKSNGRIKVEVYTGSTLVNGDQEGIEGVQRGDIAYVSPSSAPFLGFVPSVALFDLPFLYPTLDTAFEVGNNGEVAKSIKQDLEKQGLILVGVVPTGYRELTTKNTNVKSPDDLKGLKIRTQQNKNHIAMWKALGANPTPISFSELYTALQQGTVDAQENPLSINYDSKFFEVQKYTILTGHIANMGLTVFSKKIYDKLPVDLQKVVIDVSKDVNEKSFKIYKDEIGSYVQKLRDKGMTVVELTPEQKKLFQEKAKPAAEEIGKQVGKDKVDALLKEVDAVAKK